MAPNGSLKETLEKDVKMGISKKKAKKKKK
jgi:hypothetical protein